MGLVESWTALTNRANICLILCWLVFSVRCYGGNWGGADLVGIVWIESISVVAQPWFCDRFHIEMIWEGQRWVSITVQAVPRNIS